MFSNMRVYNQQTMPLLQMRMQQKQQKVPIIEDIEKKEQDRRRTAWGHPIWLFFHTLSYKIKDSSFPVVGQELLRLIHGIATNLPCPVCSDHARTYMKNINFLAIQNKEQFINFLYQFHNSVNLRKGYPIFPREELDIKYSTAILPAIYNSFEKVYQDKAYNPSHIHDEFIRNRILKNMRDWMVRNYDSHFDP
jgi:hypothetical protein